MDKKKKVVVIVIVVIAIILILLGLLFGRGKEYTVSVDTNGGNIIANKVVKEGTTIGELEVPKKDGYNFLYWTLDGERCKDSDKITKDVHLIAVWESTGEVEVTKYKVTFNVDGGSTVESVEVEEGNVLVKPEEPKKEGYTFVEWQLDGVVYDFTTTVTKDIELKAVWKKEDDITVSFDSNGGSKVASQVIKKDEVAKKPSNPTKSGYKFVEWQLDGKAYNFSNKVTKNIKLVAKWEKLITYTVTFDSNGGSSVASKTVEKDRTVAKPSNPTKSGYKFVEWQLDGKTYSFSSKVTKDIKLVAKWEQVKTYTVTFDSNGGSSVASKTVNEGSKVSKPNNPTRNGYVFKAWLLNGSTYDFNKSVTGNITLTAKWEQKTYTISVSSIDSYSPDRILTVYENGSKINVSSIKYTNGVVLCEGNNLSVNKYDIEGVTEVLVVLSDGRTQVKATIK